MDTGITLGYWDIRGLAEPIRLILNYLKVTYTDHRITSTESKTWFEDLKPKLISKNPAINLPYLRDGEKYISESEAIVIYLLHKFNSRELLGTSPDQIVAVATVMGVFRDLKKSYGSFVYGAEAKQIGIEAAKAKYYTSAKAGLTKLAALLGEKHFFTGSVTAADILVAEWIQHYNILEENLKTDFASLIAHQQRVWALDGIHQYVTSDRFKERPVNWAPDASWA